MASQAEPRNPFYLLLLMTGLLFIVTVLAYAVIPVLEQKAMDAGTMPPSSPLRDSLRENGAYWVLIEVVALVLLGLLCMGLDRYRRWQQDRGSAHPLATEASASTKVDSPLSK